MGAGGSDGEGRSFYWLTFSSRREATGQASNLHHGVVVKDGSRYKRFRRSMYGTNRHPKPTTLQHGTFSNHRALSPVPLSV